MKILGMVGVGILVAACSALAASNAVVSVPGVEIRADGSISAPGVEIGPDAGEQRPAVAVGKKPRQSGQESADAGAAVQLPGVAIEQGDGDVVFNLDGGTINTAVSQQNLLVRGNHNTFNGAGQVLTLTVEGNGNSIRLRDRVGRVVVSGNDNVVSYPNSDAKIDDRGQGNRFLKE